jgi:hypothetical protein
MAGDVGAPWLEAPQRGANLAPVSDGRESAEGHERRRRFVGGGSDGGIQGRRWAPVAPLLMYLMPLRAPADMALLLPIGHPSRRIDAGVALIRPGAT